MALNPQSWHSRQRVLIEFRSKVFLFHFDGRCHRCFFGRRVFRVEKNEGAPRLGNEAHDGTAAPVELRPSHEAVHLHPRALHGQPVRPQRTLRRLRVGSGACVALGGGLAVPLQRRGEGGPGGDPPALGTRSVVSSVAAWGVVDMGLTWASMKPRWPCAWASPSSAALRYHCTA